MSNILQNTETFYTDEQVKIITKAMPEIEKKAKECELNMVYPTINDFNKAMSHVIAYIKENGRIVYGGYALNELFKDINPKDAIYDGKNKDDIEFYSNKPLIDLAAIVNLLADKGFEQVQGIEAEHDGTYSVMVEFEKYCDITYVPTFIYNAIKTKTTKSGFRVADPSFIKIDYLRIFNNPLTGFHKIGCRFERFALLQKYYPFIVYEYKTRLPKPSSVVSKIIAEINDFIKEKDSIVVCGLKAYNVFIKSIDNKTAKEIDASYYASEVPFIDLTSINYIIDTVEIINFLKSKYDDVTYLEYYPFHEFYGYRTEIKVNGTTVAFVYDNYEKCIPYLKTNKDIKMATFNYLLMTMIMLQLRYFIEKRMAEIDQNSNLFKEKEMYYYCYGQLISNLIFVRNTFFKNTKKGPLDDTAFKEFDCRCIGETFTSKRKKMLKNKYRMEIKKPINYRYNPGDTLPEKFSFKNTSGNVIKTPARMRIKTLDVNELKKMSTSEPLEELESEEIPASGEADNTSGSSIALSEIK